MPDASGNLSAAEQDKVRQWFATHWKGTVPCPICKTTKWTAAGQVLQVSRFATDALTPGAIVYAYLPVQCDNCGHSIFFDAVKIGIVSPAPPPIPIAPNPFGGLAGTSPLASLVNPPAPGLSPPIDWAAILGKKGGGNG